MSATIRSIDLNKNINRQLLDDSHDLLNSDPSRFLQHALSKNRAAEQKLESPREPKLESLREPKSENVFQLLERALQTLESLHQKCSELNIELDISRKKIKELEEKRLDWQRIAEASIAQAKQSEQLRISLQTQLEEQSKVKNSFDQEYSNFQERVWNIFCTHSKSYAILKEIADAETDVAGPQAS